MVLGKEHISDDGEQPLIAYDYVHGAFRVSGPFSRLVLNGIRAANADRRDEIDESIAVFTRHTSRQPATEADARQGLNPEAGEIEYIRVAEGSLIVSGLRHLAAKGNANMKRLVARLGTEYETASRIKAAIEPDEAEFHEAITGYWAREAARLAVEAAAEATAEAPGTEQMMADIRTHVDRMIDGLGTPPKADWEDGD